MDLKSTNLRHILTVHRNEPDTLWVDICFEATNWKGDLYNAEPNVHSELAWFSPDGLPENTIPAIRFYIEQIEAGNNYAEYGWS